MTYGPFNSTNFIKQYACMCEVEGREEREERFLGIRLCAADDVSVVKGSGDGHGDFCEGVVATHWYSESQTRGVEVCFGSGMTPRLPLAIERNNM